MNITGTLAATMVAPALLNQRKEPLRLLFIEDRCTLGGKVLIVSNLLPIIVKPGCRLTSSPISLLTE